MDAVAEERDGMTATSVDLGTEDAVDTWAESGDITTGEGAQALPRKKPRVKAANTQVIRIRTAELLFFKGMHLPH